jgi:hypothetical protein
VRRQAEHGAGHRTSLRRLFHVAMPLPDEPLDSWVEFMAHSYGATVGEMARALGLIGGKVLTRSAILTGVVHRARTAATPISNSRPGGRAMSIGR